MNERHPHTDASDTEQAPNHVPIDPPSAQSPPAKPSLESWHWQRPDPLGSMYAGYPFKLFMRDHVGLDIGSHWIKYAVTRHGAGKPRILVAGGVPLRTQGQGEMGKIRAQVGALLAIREKVARTSQRWTVGISGPGTIVRSVEVPRMPARELRRAVLWQAQKKIPFPLDEAHVAVHYIKTGSDQPVRAIVASATRRIVDDLLYLLAEAEIRPSAVTLPAFSLGALLSRTGYNQRGQQYGLLDIGAERSLFAVYRGEVMEFFREIDLGIGDVEEVLADDARINQRYQGVHADRASEILFERGVEFDPDHPAANEDAAYSVNAALEKLLFEIQNTLEYYSAQSGGLRINTFLLLGGGAKIPGIEKHLSAFLELPVKLLNPMAGRSDTALAEYRDLVTPANWASAYGYSLLPRRTPNLLPPEYLREQDAESRSMLWRTVTGTAVALSLAVSGGEFYRGEFAENRLNLLQNRLSQTEAKLEALGVPDMESTLASHRGWLSAVSRQDINTATILRTLAALTPETIALDRVEMRLIDSGWAHVSFGGEVRTDHDQDEVVLARYMERLRQTGWFSQITLEGHVTKRKPQYEQLTFTVSMRAPLEIDTP